MHPHDLRVSIKHVTAIWHCSELQVHCVHFHVLLAPGKEQHHGKCTQHSWAALHVVWSFLQLQLRCTSRASLSLNCDNVLCKAITPWDQSSLPHQILFAALFLRIWTSRKIKLNYLCCWAHGVCLVMWRRPVVQCCCKLLACFSAGLSCQHGAQARTCQPWYWKGRSLWGRWAMACTLPLHTSAIRCAETSQLLRECLCCGVFQFIFSSSEWDMCIGSYVCSETVISWVLMHAGKCKEHAMTLPWLWDPDSFAMEGTSACKHSLALSWHKNIWPMFGRLWDTLHLQMIEEMSMAVVMSVAFSIPTYYFCELEGSFFVFWLVWLISLADGIGEQMVLSPAVFNFIPSCFWIFSSDVRRESGLFWLRSELKENSFKHLKYTGEALCAMTTAILPIVSFIRGTSIHLRLRWSAK